MNDNNASMAATATKLPQTYNHPWANFPQIIMQPVTPGVDPFIEGRKLRVSNGYERSYTGNSREQDTLTGFTATTGLTAGLLAGVSKSWLIGSVMATGLTASPLVALAGITGAGALAGIAVGKAIPHMPKISKLASKAMIWAGKKALGGLVQGTKYVSSKNKEIMISRQNSQLQKSNKAVIATRETHDNSKIGQSARLEEMSKAVQERSNKFKQIVSNVREDMKAGKDIKDQLKEVHSLRTPTYQSIKEKNALTADYLIRNNSKDAKLDTKGLENSVKSLAKEFNLSKAETKQLFADTNSRVEKMKDDLMLTKDNKYVTLAKTAKETAKESTNSKEQQFAQKQEEAKEKKQEQKVAAKHQKENAAKEQQQAQGKSQQKDKDLEIER